MLNVFQAAPRVAAEVTDRLGVRTYTVCGRLRRGGRPVEPAALGGAGLRGSFFSAVLLALTGRLHNT